MSRADNLATVAALSDTFLGYPDDSIFRSVFDKLGWDAFTDEAIAEFAEWHVWRTKDRERRNAESRAIYAAALAEQNRRAA